MGRVKHETRGLEGWTDGPGCLVRPLRRLALRRWHLGGYGKGAGSKVASLL